METIQEKKMLIAEAISYIEKTPFKNFFNVFLKERISRQDLRKSATNLDEIITSFDRKQKAFKIGKKFLKITHEDISLIFGMPLAGEELFPIPPSNRAAAMEHCAEFLNANFQEDEIISKKNSFKTIESNDQ